MYYKEYLHIQWQDTKKSSIGDALLSVEIAMRDFQISESEVNYVDIIQCVYNCMEDCSPAAEEIISSLIDLKNAAKYEWDKIIGSIGNYGILLNDLEKLILISTLYYTDQELSAKYLL